MFALEFTASALDDLRYLRRFEQSLILDAIERQLTGEPLTPTRNRTPLRPNDLAAWERRIEKYRVFYDVNVERYLVKVKAVGWKDRDRLIIRGREFVL
jgi:mRNA-degrading endonuclease RelE of RelBE toxin-antitoxin system